LHIKRVRGSNAMTAPWQRVALEKGKAGVAEVASLLKGFSSAQVRDIKQRLLELESESERGQTNAGAPGGFGASGAGPSPGASKYAVLKKKSERRDLKSERKAEASANLEHSIGQELLSRLRQGVYNRDVATSAEKAKDVQSRVAERNIEEVEDIEDLVMDKQESANLIARKGKKVKKLKAKMAKGDKKRAQASDEVMADPLVEVEWEDEKLT